MKSLLIFMVIVFSCSVLYGESREKIDSLKQEIKKARHDTAVASLYYLLGEEFFNSDKDSALVFYLKGIELCRSDKWDEKSKAGFKKREGDLLRSIGNIYIQRSEYEVALDHINKALDCYLNCDDDYGKAQSYKSIGAIKYFQGDAVSSIKAFQSAMKIAEESSNMESYSDCLNNIGMVHYQQDNNEIAMTYFNKALKIRMELGIKLKIAESYNNLGIVHSDNSNAKRSLDYYFKALEIFNELEDNVSAGKIYNNVGVVYREMGDIDNAEKYFNLSIENRKKIGDRQGIALVLGNLAETSMLKEDYRNAVLLADSSLAMAKELGALQVVSNAYGHLYEAYEKTGDFKTALEFHKLLKSTSDSLSSVSKFETISEMEAKYENEKKQLLIENLTKEKALQQIQLSRQRNMIIFIVIGLVMVIVFSLLLFRQSRARKIANLMLARQNVEIQQKNEEISAQRDEIESQRDEIITQRDLVFMQKEQIEVIHKKVTDSINYAKRIQEAVLPGGETSRNLLGDHFILFMPKDIVSGDFYWGTRINNWLIVTVADCTGHGVPGAFMSMLGISFLNEIVRKKEITSTSEVLDNLRESIIEALQQKGQSGEQKDGMDIALCAIQTDAESESGGYLLQYSGANNPLYIVNADAGIIEIEPDKQPVSIYEKMKPFTNHILRVKKGDMLYLTSDGYADQFCSHSAPGGSRKFKTKQLKELFVRVFEKPVEEQQAILNLTFEKWRGSGPEKHDQIDDVTILGLRIP